MKVDPKLIEAGVNAWLTSAGVRNPSQQMKGDAASVAKAILAAVIPAIQAEALERAAVAGRKAWPKAHTYASENADMYRAQDHAVETVLAAIRALKEGT